MLNTNFFHPNYSSGFDLEAEANINPTHKEGQVRNIIIADPGIYFELSLPDYEGVDMDDIKKIMIGVTLSVTGRNITFYNYYQIMRSGSSAFVAGSEYKILMPFPDPNFRNQASMDYEIKIEPQGGGETYTHSGTAIRNASGSNARLESNNEFRLRIGNTTSGVAAEPSEARSLQISNIMCSEKGVGFTIYWSDDLVTRIKWLAVYVALDNRQYCAFEMNPEPRQTSMEFHHRPAVFWAPIPQYSTPLTPDNKALKIWMQVDLGNGWINPGDGQLNGLVYDQTSNVIAGDFNVETFNLNSTSKA